MTKIKIGSDFSGVGAFNQALIRLGIAYEEVFACDMDKYARQTFELNYGKPKDFPKDVYEREIPKESLDIYMTSPPCQAFSMAGKRLGKEDQRGILFFNSLEFIRENKPRYFIFENVKGLLSHDKVDKNQEFGRTFQEWINYLGGKSINGVHTFFPYEDAVPYHIYFQVLNAKHYGIPQNRERIFIIGIRDDEDNDFQFPKPFPLEKRLKDVLEEDVDEKYFLSDKMIENITYNKKSNGEIANLNKGGERGSVYDENTKVMSCIAATDFKQPKQIQIADYRADEGLRIREDGNSPCITSSIRHTEEFKPNAGTRNPPLVIFTNEPKIGAIRGRNPTNPKSRQSGLETEQMLEINENGTSKALTTVQKDNVVVIQANTSKGYDEAEEEEDSINFSVPSSTTRRGRVGKKVSQTLDTQCNQGIVTKQLSKQENEWIKGGLQENQPKQTDGISPCLTSAMGMGGGHTPVHNYQQRIRRLTPLECFRLMDFNEDFKWNVSDSQAYKQAGNSICVGVLVEIIKKLKL